MVSELAQRTQRALQGGNLLRDVTTAVDHALREPLPMLWWVVPEFCQRAPSVVSQR
jgi:GAF domain-containing protein